MPTLQESAMQTKPVEYGHGLIVKELSDKVLVTTEGRTHIKEGNFTLDAEVIHIESGPGVKISSKGRDTLVISVNTTNIEEKIFDLNKRFEIIEKGMAKIMRAIKQ